jgi:hypothetical protein
MKGKEVICVDGALLFSGGNQSRRIIIYAVHIH